MEVACVAGRLTRHSVARATPTASSLQRIRGQTLCGSLKAGFTKSGQVANENPWPKAAPAFDGVAGFRGSHSRVWWPPVLGVGPPPPSTGGNQGLKPSGEGRFGSDRGHTRL